MNEQITINLNDLSNLIINALYLIDKEDMYQKYEDEYLNICDAVKSMLTEEQLTDILDALNYYCDYR